MYAKYQESYGWTIQEIDDTDMVILLDQLVVLSKKDRASDKKMAYIEDVL